MRRITLWLLSTDLDPRAAVQLPSDAYITSLQSALDQAGL
jgi:hypothetical protein